MKGFTDFREKTLRQIRLWAWAAAVLPISALAGIFFVWRFGTDSWVSIAMIVGETTMFVAAVVWWWWAMYTMKKLIKQWDVTKDNVVEVLTDLKEIKVMVKETTASDK